MVRSTRQTKKFSQRVKDTNHFLKRHRTGNTKNTDYGALTPTTTHAHNTHRKNDKITATHDNTRGQPDKRNDTHEHTKTQTHECSVPHKGCRTGRCCSRTPAFCGRGTALRDSTSSAQQQKQSENSAGNERTTTQRSTKDHQKEDEQA